MTLAELAEMHGKADAIERVNMRVRITQLEMALTNLMQKSVDHIIAGHPINSDALAALREAERVLTNR